jgi:cell division protein FtsB
LTDTLSRPAGAATPDGAPLAPEAVVEAVYGGFSAKNRERISRDDVARVVAELELEEERPRRKSPTLRVRQLRFAGEKRLRDQSPEPFVYDQAFAPGVNVICIPVNEVGKSSILKTIKYALTGDNGDLDADVRSWITDVWLAFALDRQEFTVLLSTRGGSPRALLVPGEEFGPIETVAEETTLAIVDVSGAEAIKAELRRFFFQRQGLGRLSWTQQDASAPGGVAERSTSWLTYFQALQIPDGGDRYLLCDTQHAIGNQDGLILSAFLGLNLVEPLNQLGLEAARARKEVKLEERLTAEQVQQAKEEAGRLEAELQVARARLREIASTQAARRRAVEGGEPAQRLVAAQLALVERASERARLEAEREELNRTLQRRRARERQLREVVVLQLHFTGLEVSLCPNCDAAVDSVAVEREQTAHTCRLCGKPAQDADAQEIAALNAEADDIKREIDDMAQGRDAITARLGALRREIEALTAEVVTFTEAAQRGIEFALPTAEEEAEGNGLHERVGRLQAELGLARRRAEPPATEDNELELRVRVVEKVRDVLRDEAARRNRGLLERLSALTQDTARTIGAESISDVTCSPLGKVELRKHGERVSFTGIQNEGERLRIKLAFFLAMMRLGREPGLGRHPGFLLVDQPGSGEMVPEDSVALAEIFCRVDDELADRMQIICCTARREFEAATAPEKVYGPQNPPYAF